MKASDIAKDLDREGKFPGHVCYGTSPLLVRAANMLRKQQAEIEVLKQQVELLSRAFETTCDGMQTSLELNKAQAERHRKAQEK
jgi:hypothetical protein